MGVMFDEKKIVSIHLALSRGRFDGILQWLFQSTIEVSCINQVETADKSTQKITPNDNNFPSFNRAT